MADNSIPGQPLGEDAIKGGIFFGSNLTPAGTFPNVPSFSSTNIPTTVAAQKLVLTLEQIKEELKQSLKLEHGTTQDAVSNQALNTFLTTFVQLTIDYRDLRNYVFYGSAYTEMVYHINQVIENYPYESYFAELLTSPGIQLDFLSNNRTRISLAPADVLQPATYTYDSSGKTNWPNYDIVDTNGTRFPILSINSPIQVTNAVGAIFSLITITTATPHNLLTGDSITIAGITSTGFGNLATASNGTHTITVTGPNTFGINGTTSQGLFSSYTGGGTIVLSNRIHLIVDGILSTNNFVEYQPAPLQDYKGLLVAFKVKDITDFQISLPGEQQALLSPSNQTPWPRDPVTNNIITSGPTFDQWISNSTNMVPDLGDDLGLIDTDPNSLNLRGALALDESDTNQLIRRAIPDKLVDELNDPDDSFFTRFVLVAGKLFDEIKVYIDFLKYVHELNYGSFNQLSPEFYKVYAEHYGFDLFDDDTVDLAKAIVRTEPGLRYDISDNPVFDDKTTSKTVQQLQHEKQKRLLLNLLYLYKTKGTQKCIQFLTSLLGSPEGLIVLDEFAFNRTTGLKQIDNIKYSVPQMNYEIDPQYLKDAININNPINLPYVYRLKLDNEDVVNLREIKIITDPEAAIATQILNYGTIKYPYAHFKPGAFANLQNPDQDYFLLPLNFPDKFTGVTVEYMIPKDGFPKGIPLPLTSDDVEEEATIHLASLYEVGAIGYTGTTPNKILKTVQYAYPVPGLFIDTLAGTTQEQTQIRPNRSATFRFISNGTPGDSLVLLTNGANVAANSLWQSTLSDSVHVFVSAINNRLPVLAAEKCIAFLQDNLDGTFDIIVQGKHDSAAVNTVEILTNGLNDSTNVDTTGSFSNPISTTSFVPLTSSSAQYIICRLEGNDLVIRAKFAKETFIPFTTPYNHKRVAIFRNIFQPDGLNHQLRLIYRPEGVEVYQDFKFLGLAEWQAPQITFFGTTFYEPIDAPRNFFPLMPISHLPSSVLFAYPDKDNILNFGSNLGFDQSRWWDLFVGLPTNVDVFFTRVAVFDSLSVDMPDVLDFGISLSGTEDEKYSFNLKNQIVDINSVKLQNKISVFMNYRAPNPDAPDTIPLFENYFIGNYASNEITDVNLISKDYLFGESQYVEDLQGFYKLPPNTPYNTDQLFKYNAWSPTIHKDYDYKTFYDAAYGNYEAFSNQVLTYASLLPFMELIENKFHSLILQFIPIVVNISDFGRLLKNNPFNQLKEHYANIHFECDGTENLVYARGKFDLISGTYNPGVNKITVNIAGISPINQDWQSTNNQTLILLATTINTTYAPNIVAQINYNHLEIIVDPNWYFNTFAVDINTVTCNVVGSGDVVIQNLQGFTGGELGLVGTCGNFVVTRTSTPTPIPVSYTYLYYNSENGAPTYIYDNSEGNPPLYV